MAKLMLECNTEPSRATIGGVPHAPDGTAWPTCAECNSPMQFLAQLPLHDLGIPNLTNRHQLLLLFQCQANPGLCDEWDPDAGGNAALLVSADDAEPLAVPAGETQLPAVSMVTLQDYDDSPAHDTPDDAYCEALDASDLVVLGKTAGVPLWIQGDETPSCDCGERMQFVAQIEAAGGGGINFGDVGAGYAFVCRTCPASSKFLWQCG